MQSTHTWSTVLHAISIGDLNINEMLSCCRLLPSFWQVADAQEVRWACCLAAFASHTILHTWWRRHLLGSVDSGGDHLQHISRTGANTKSAANASVVDFHCMGPSSHLHAFRVQKRDEHSIQVLYICYYMFFRCVSERLLAAKDQGALLWNLQELKDDEISLQEKALSLRLRNIWKK